MSLVEAWSPATLAVLVDAAITSAPTPGRIHRCALKDVAGSPVLRSHALDVSGAIALGEALDRLPDQLVILTVEAEDTGHGVGLTQKVAGHRARSRCGRCGRDYA
jgi:hydrogenase maturation protease